MNLRKFLAVFLSATMFLPYTRCIGSNASAQSLSAVKSSIKGMSKNTKRAVGVGAGVLGVAGVALTGWAIHQKRKNDVKKEITRRAVCRLNLGTPQNTVSFESEGLYFDDIFDVVKKDSSTTVACYYGKNAFRNYIKDYLDSMKDSRLEMKSYAHSDNIIRYSEEDGKYVFDEPKLFENNKTDKLKYYIEFNGVMRKAEYNVTQGNDGETYFFIFMYGDGKLWGTVKQTEDGLHYARGESEFKITYDKGSDRWVFE